MTESNFIYGIRPIIEAVRAGKYFDKVMISKKATSELMSELLETLSVHEIPYQYVPYEKLNRFTRKNHQGVVAIISPVPFDKIENIVPGLYESGKTPFIVMLDEITDIRNFGAICRTCEAAGVHAIVVPFKGSAMISADAVKTSAGAVYHIPICKVKNMSKALEFLKQSGLLIYAATEKASKYHFTADMVSPCVIVMGSEEKGIHTEIMKKCDELLRIPMHGETESLNVSVAAGIMVYEVVRQREE